ncbi:MAG TPA: phosphoadenosine phosphosulfate reductase family protein [Bryobacteraceae bacterium]|nr:phosphoadenosine phosphosulfate reductase family protein [Bryobacteraceae bacterium]
MGSKNQRPELWNLYNSKVEKGESIRVFPLSNWTEMDVWAYVELDNIPIIRSTTPRNARW